MFTKNKTVKFVVSNYLYDVSVNNGNFHEELVERFMKPIKEYYQDTSKIQEERKILNIEDSYYTTTTILELSKRVFRWSKEKTYKKICMASSTTISKEDIITRVETLKKKYNIPKYIEPKKLKKMIMKTMCTLLHFDWFLSRKGDINE